MAPTEHPLQAVMDACAPLRFAPLPDIRAAGFRSAPQRHGTETWHRTDLMAAEGDIAVLFDRYTAQHGPGHTLPNSTRFQRALLREPIFLVSAGLYLTGRAPLLDREHLWFPSLSDGSFGTPTLTSVRMAVLPDDPVADHPDTVVVATEAAQETMAAEHLVHAFSPIIDGVARHTRVGVRTLWGWVLDIAHFYMLNPARFLGHDAGAAWSRASRLGDALTEAGAHTRSRPRIFPFHTEHPRGTWAVRGTCCFDYKADPEHGFCVTCPLKADSERHEELQDWLRNPSIAP